MLMGGKTEHMTAMNHGVVGAQEFFEDNEYAIVSTSPHSNIRKS